MIYRLRTVLTLVTLLSVPLPSSGAPGRQDAAQAPATTASSTTPDETVYLIALDKEGRPVTDLKQEEFQILEDKVEQKIASLSAVTSDPLTIGFFFDISGSRQADRHVIEETQLVSKLLHSIWKEGDSVFLVGFSQQPIAVIQPTQNLEQLDEGLGQIPGGFWGPTALYDALFVAKPEKLNALSGRKVYVVLSDFQDNSSKHKLEDVLELAHQGRIAIFPVILGEGFGEMPSKRLEKRTRQNAQEIADRTGAEVLTPESPKQLAAAFERLASELAAAYRLSYTPSLPSADRRKKKLKIETTRPQVKLLFAKG